MKKFLFGFAAVLLLSAPVYAQKGAPFSGDCTNPGEPEPQVVNSKGGKWVLFCGERTDDYKWVLKVDGAITDIAFIPQDTPNAESGLYQFYSQTPVTLAPGRHTLSVALIRLDGTGTTVIESTDLDVNSIVSTSTEPCTPPLGTEAISVYITRYLVGGSKTDISFLVTSKSPVSSISVLIDGAVVKTKKTPGVDSQDFSGLWIPTPSTGRHDLGVSATNEVGCTTIVTSSLKMQVK